MTERSDQRSKLINFPGQMGIKGLAAGGGTGDGTEDVDVAAVSHNRCLRPTSVSFSSKNVREGVVGSDGGSLAGFAVGLS